MLFSPRGLLRSDAPRGLLFPGAPNLRFSPPAPILAPPPRDASSLILRHPHIRSAPGPYPSGFLDPDAPLDAPSRVARASCCA